MSNIPRWIVRKQDKNVVVQCIQNRGGSDYWFFPEYWSGLIQKLKVKISFWKTGFSWQVLSLMPWNLSFYKINHTFCLWSQDLWVLFGCKNLNHDYVSQLKLKARILFCLLAFLERLNQVWMDQWNACWVPFSNQWKLQTRLAVSQPSLGLFSPDVPWSTENAS